MNYTYSSIVFCSLGLLMFTSHFRIYKRADYMTCLTAKPILHQPRIFHFFDGKLKPTYTTMTTDSKRQPIIFYSMHRPRHITSGCCQRTPGMTQNKMKVMILYFAPGILWLFFLQLVAVHIYSVFVLATTKEIGT
jgi:hypothetical protein